VKQRFIIEVIVEAPSAIPDSVVGDVVRYSSACLAIEDGLNGWLEHQDQDGAVEVTVFEVVE